MSAYPSAFDPGAFPAIPPPVAQARAKVADALIARMAVEVRGSLRVGAAADAAVTGLWIESVADARRKSQSLRNFDGVVDAIDPAAHFFFLPGVDGVKICFTVDQPAKATKAVFELFANGQPAAIWTHEDNAGVAVGTLTGGHIGGDRLAIVGNPAFPAGVPNVPGAPYQLRLTVAGSAGRVTSAWTYFDVLVQSLELHWGPAALIPAGAIADVLPVMQPLTNRDELALVNGLRNVATTIDPAAAVELALKSTNAAYVHLNEWYSWRDFGFLRFKARWGKGPRIPILAKVTMKSLDHPAGIHSAASARALGPAEFLWDWKDKDEATRQGEIAGVDASARAFVMAGLKFKQNAANEPPACLNCHADRGGKRGSADRVLPTFNNAATFPFEVSEPAARKWGALSKALPTGPYAGHTGVVFQPSRMAGDSYQLRVFLATGPHQATLDVAATKMDDLVLNHPGLPTAGTGMMEVRRQIDARYVRKGTTTPRIDLDAVRDEYKKGGIKVVWTEDTWAMAHFNNYMNTALAPDNAAEDATAVRHRIFRTNATARRNGLNGWTVPVGVNNVVSPVKTSLPLFDQWFGTAAGAMAPAQPSAANFTLPSRQIVVDSFIEQAVAAYISKNRKINDKQRKWNAFQVANPGVAAPQLRVRFFNQILKASERTKIMPDIRVRYENAGWRGWDVAANDPDEWVRENYQFRTSKLVYLAEEMHLRKVLADAFEGVTLFHYQHFVDVLNADGTLYARQCAIGGVAAVNLNSDLGLTGAFLVWDHPTNGQRQALARHICQARGTQAQGVNGHTGDRHGECTFKDGNSTVIHEFGHFLHLPHATPQGGTDEAAMHDQADVKCIMNYDPDALHLCGGCLLRLRGWAFFQSKGMVGFDATNPNNPGIVPPAPPTAGLPALFNNFYPDFV